MRMRVRSGDAVEDTVAGDQLQTELECGGSHPPIGFVDLLGQRVPGTVRPRARKFAHLPIRRPSV